MRLPQIRRTSWTVPCGPAVLPAGWGFPRGSKLRRRRVEMQTAEHLTNLTTSSYSKVNMGIKTAEDPLSSVDLMHCFVEAIAWGSTEVSSRARAARYPSGDVSQVCCLPFPLSFARVLDPAGVLPLWS